MIDPVIKPIRQRPHLDAKTAQKSFDMVSAIVCIQSCSRCDSWCPAYDYLHLTFFYNYTIPICLSEGLSSIIVIVLLYNN